MTIRHTNKHIRIYQNVVVHLNFNITIFASTKDSEKYMKQCNLIFTTIIFYIKNVVYQSIFF